MINFTIFKVFCGTLLSSDGLCLSDTKKHMYQYIQERVGLKVCDLQITKTQQKRKLLTLQKLDTLSSYNPVETREEYRILLSRL